MNLFGLPSPLPTWPPGKEFATGKISLGEIDIALVSTFTEVWSVSEGGVNNQGATFFRPVNVPPGFSSFGYYSQPNNGLPEGWILVAKQSLRTISECSGTSRETTLTTAEESNAVSSIGTKIFPLPPLASPVAYKLVWSSTKWKTVSTGPAYFWLPSAPDGYKAIGCIVTNTEKSPDTNEVVCIRSDLTDVCMTDYLIWDIDSKASFNVWSLKPLTIGTEAKGIPVGTFYCGNMPNASESLPIACLQNTDFILNSLPNVEQLHALASNYGPTVFFHPDEAYLPSSIYWFFGKGANIYKKGETTPVKILFDGSNLPVGGTNDGEYWIDLPSDGTADEVKKGYLSSAEVYIHAKPMLGGIYTDLAMWIYYPFNGASTAKLGAINLKLGRIGEHVSDWEHFTLRISNITGELRAIYFSQHSGGTWLEASNLEYMKGNKAAIYSSKNGHASYPHPGLVLQGDQKLGLGIRNDTAKSGYVLDSSKSYEIVSAEYLQLRGDSETITEPVWLEYMREWGPKIQYDTKAELGKILKKLPLVTKAAVLALIKRLPRELLEEEGPTGPKEKRNWYGDEVST